MIAYQHHSVSPAIRRGQEFLGLAVRVVADVAGRHDRKPAGGLTDDELGEFCPLLERKEQHLAGLVRNSIFRLFRSIFNWGRV